MTPGPLDISRLTLLLPGTRALTHTHRAYAHTRTHTYTARPYTHRAYVRLSNKRLIRTHRALDARMHRGISAPVTGLLPTARRRDSRLRLVSASFPPLTDAAALEMRERHRRKFDTLDHGERICSAGTR